MLINIFGCCFSMKVLEAQYYPISIFSYIVQHWGIVVIYAYPQIVFLRRLSFITLQLLWGCVWNMYWLGYYLAYPNQAKFLHKVGYTIRRDQHVLYKLKDVNWLNMERRRFLHFCILFQNSVATGPTLSTL